MEHSRMIDLTRLNWGRGGRTAYSMMMVEDALASGKTVMIACASKEAAEPWKERFGDRVKYDWPGKDGRKVVEPKIELIEDP